MDDHISRTILKNFEVDSVENAHQEIHKINSTNLLRNIENGSLQFIVRGDSEFIDHSLLSPEYITTTSGGSAADISGNNFIIGLMGNQESNNISTSNEHHRIQSSPYLVTDTTLSNDIQFSINNPETDQEKRLTTTILQLIKSGNLRVDSDTQFIVTNNKEVIGITDKDNLDLTHFLTIDDHQNLIHQNSSSSSLLNEGQLRIFQSQYQQNHQQQQSTVLPQLTPIRRLSRPKNTLNLNSLNNDTDLKATVQVESTRYNQLNGQQLQSQPNLHHQQQSDIQQQAQQIQHVVQQQQKPFVAKKVLPHKKRYGLTKKLKSIDRSDISLSTTGFQKQQTVLLSSAISSATDADLMHQINFYQDEPNDILHDNETLHIVTPQFSCQICGSGFQSQLDFFSHLKEHYEPIKDEAMASISKDVMVIEEKIKTSSINDDLNDLNTLQFANFSTVAGSTLVDSVEQSFSSQIHCDPSHQQQQRLYSEQQDKQFSLVQSSKQLENSRKFLSTAIDYNPITRSKLNNLAAQIVNFDESDCNDSSSVSAHHQNHPTLHQNLISSSALTSNFVESLSTSPILPQLTQTRNILLTTTDEFSEPEDMLEGDMLEGIRNVVDKVQESDNDEMDITSSRENWFSNSALNGSSTPRINTSTGSTIDQFQIFFKNDDDSLRRISSSSSDNLQPIRASIQQHQLQKPLLHCNSDNQTTTDLQKINLPSIQTNLIKEEQSSSDGCVIKTPVEHQKDSCQSSENNVIKINPLNMPEEKISPIKKRSVGRPRKDTISDSTSKGKNKDTKRKIGSITMTLLAQNSLPVNTDLFTVTMSGKSTSEKDEPSDCVINIHPEKGPILPSPNYIKKKSSIKNGIGNISSSSTITFTNNCALPSAGVVPLSIPTDTNLVENKTSSPLLLSSDSLNLPVSVIESSNSVEVKRRRGRPPKSKDLNDIDAAPLQIPTKVVNNPIYFKSEEIEAAIELYDDFYDAENDTEESGDECTEKDKKQKKKHICEKCHKIFNSINALKYHDFSHTGLRPYKCEHKDCGKSFFALNALKAHQRVHSGDKPFNCEICFRAFRQWGDLTYHKISIHSNKKDFQCEFCGKSFARKYSLVIHRRIHTGERNYSCEFCTKTFRASSYLQNHRKIHTGEKPYSCATCGKTFRVCGDLKRHSKIHDRDKKGNKEINNVIEKIRLEDLSNVLKKIDEDSNESDGNIDEIRDDKLVRTKEINNKE